MSNVIKFPDKTNTNTIEWTEEVELTPNNLIHPIYGEMEYVCTTPFEERVEETAAIGKWIVATTEDGALWIYDGDEQYWFEIAT